ncbi:FAD/NAD(P)-binding domain-containing protein [Hyaloscypha variabilis F]|uniref:FAD/NAD(P)-binding domain-containing protein n=1 Tax=Hyaloscypha variabilis (strain UAMH 11265 / GT02V1 / F) TaxID=1149755 RepID=A0A2J6S2C7_HYAVF|nr:FAD/NAD(P)-binding domain-containing protein [Hyaloscypha variabilis F]
MEHRNVAIIGAGWSGLSLAKTYTQAHPDADLIVLEAADSVGGVWAAHRLYPGLRTNSILGSYENPDFPMTVEKFGVKPGEHIPGTVVHQYMTDFAKTFDIWRRIRFRTKVEEIQQVENGKWILKLTTFRSTNGEGTMETKSITADKVVIATGVTGNPNMPDITGADTFDAPLFHAKDFLQNKELLKTANKVVVYGGSKSAWDAVYAYSTSGIQVEWVIRESGGGPCWMSPIWVTPLKKCLEHLVLTRLLSLFTPTFLGNGDGYDIWRRLLHGTAIGRWFVRKFWGTLEGDVVQLNGWDKDSEIKKLKPWFPAFWSGPSLSILNYPTDFFECIKNGTARIHYAEITHLTRRTVHLSTGEAFEVDALHCSTGWKHEPPIKISPPSLAAKLGLPTDFDDSRTDLTRVADAEILERFPSLRNQPEVTAKRHAVDIKTRKTPYRLYRSMVPPATAYERNFAIAGAVLSLGSVINAQMQALWITAYLDGSLELPKSMDEIEYSTELSTRFGHWRYPADYGDRHAALAFDSLPYFDELLRDLGLRFQRKGSWWRELLEDYRPADYKGVVDEWIELKRTLAKKDE